MCGRFKAGFEFRDLKIRWQVRNDFYDFQAHYNIAPTQMHPIIVERAGAVEARPMRWGLVPYWAKDQAIGNKMINARSETLMERPAFRELLSSRRCLVPADGFYEWRKEGKTKQPMLIHLIPESGEAKEIAVFDPAVALNADGRRKKYAKDCALGALNERNTSLR